MDKKKPHGKAVGVLKELSADERTRMLYENREKARMDYESRVDDIDKKWQIIVAGKDAALAGKDAALADKDTALADKDAEIEWLRNQLEKQNNKDK